MSFMLGPRSILQSQGSCQLAASVHESVLKDIVDNDNTSDKFCCTSWLAKGNTWVCTLDHFVDVTTAFPSSYLPRRWHVRCLPTQPVVDVIFVFLIVVLCVVLLVRYIFTLQLRCPCKLLMLLLYFPNCKLDLAFLVQCVLMIIA